MIVKKPGQEWRLTGSQSQRSFDNRGVRGRLGKKLRRTKQEWNKETKDNIRSMLQPNPSQPQIAANESLELHGSDTKRPSATPVIKIPQRPLKLLEVPPPKIRKTKRLVKKMEQNQKNHISHICRWNPWKYRIIAFTQHIAALWIQWVFAWYIETR